MFYWHKHVLVVELTFEWMFAFTKLLYNKFFIYRDLLGSSKFEMRISIQIEFYNFCPPPLGYLNVQTCPYICIWFRVSIYPGGIVLGIFRRFFFLILRPFVWNVIVILFKLIISCVYPKGNMSTQLLPRPISYSE